VLTPNTNRMLLAALVASLVQCSGAHLCAQMWPRPNMAERMNVRHHNAPRVTLAVVGDVMLGSAVADVGREDGPDAPFSASMPQLSKAYAVVGNLECALSERGKPTVAKGAVALKKHREWLLRGDPAAAAGLKRAGFAAMSLANNHTMDYGPAALRDTITALDGAGVAHSGAGATIAQAWQPAYFTRDGTRFALLAFSDVVPRGFAAARNGAGIAVGRSMVSGDVDDASIVLLRRAVERARRNADIVIVYEHWGTELVATPSADQIRAAHAAIDAGASLVVGAHPHVLGPIEPYRTGLIAYSLGNFVFDAYPGPAAQSEILDVTWRGDRIESWRAVPIEIWSGIPHPIGATSKNAADRR